MPLFDSFSIGRHEETGNVEIQFGIRNSVKVELTADMAAALVRRLKHDLRNNHGMDDSDFQ